MDDAVGLFEEGGDEAGLLRSWGEEALFLGPLGFGVHGGRDGFGDGFGHGGGCGDGGGFVGWFWRGGFGELELGCVFVVKLDMALRWAKRM